MDVKDILRLATNPLVTGALGAYIAKEKLGPKFGTVVSMAGGALAGAIAGALVQQFLLPKPATAPALAPAAQQGVGLPPGLVNLDFGALPAQPQRRALPAPVAGPEPLPDGEGIFNKTSYDTNDGLAADAVMDEVKRNGWGN
jgi:hypothetical protein